MPKRRETWRQETPRMQVVALISAAMGNINNVNEGTTKQPLFSLASAEEFLRQAQQIMKLWVPQGTWDQTVERS